LNLIRSYAPSKKEEEDYWENAHCNLSDGTYELEGTTITVNGLTFKKSKPKVATPAGPFVYTPELYVQ